MTLTFNIRSDGGPGVSADYVRRVIRIGCCTLGVAGSVYEADPGQDLTDTLGYGPLAAADARAAIYSPNAERFALKVAATTAGTISSVTQSGSGPLITVAGSAMDAVSATPYGEYKVKVKVLTGGALSSGAVVVAVALDGASYVYEFAVPTQSQGTVIGTVDLTTLTLPGDLDTLTLELDLESPILDSTITFSAPADPAAVVSQVNANSYVDADLVQGKFLRIRRTAVGPGKTVAVKSSSTAEVVLGLSTTEAGGGASTITIPGTGLVITFPDGTYVKGEIYSFTTTAPRCSLSAMTAALTAAVTADPELAFGLFVPVQTPLDDVDLRAYVDALDVIVAAYEAAEDKRFVRYAVGAPINGTDNADKAALASHVSRYGTVVSRDCFMNAPTTQPQGRLRVSAVEIFAIRHAAMEVFSNDVGDGSLPALECYLKGADGTLARNESTASVKLGGSQGPGFTVLRLKNGQAFFKRGVTRAGSTGSLARFVDHGVATATQALATVLIALLEQRENVTFELNPDGTIAEFEAAAQEKAFEQGAKEQFVPTHFSNLVITVNRTEIIADTRTFKIDYKALIRGQGEHVQGTLTVGGTVTSAE